MDNEFWDTLNRITISGTEFQLMGNENTLVTIPRHAAEGIKDNIDTSSNFQYGFVSTCIKSMRWEENGYICFTNGYGEGILLTDWQYDGLRQQIKLHLEGDPSHEITPLAEAGIAAHNGKMMIKGENVVTFYLGSEEFTAIEETLDSARKFTAHRDKLHDGHYLVSGIPAPDGFVPVTSIKIGTKKYPAPGNDPSQLKLRPEHSIAIILSSGQGIETSLESYYFLEGMLRHALQFKKLEMQHKFKIMHGCATCHNNREAALLTDADLVKQEPFPDDGVPSSRRFSDD